MSIRALIIAYYWAPAGGPGVQRWIKFTTYFKDYGIEPIVFVPENAHYPIIDTSIISEIPTDIDVIKFPIKEPYKWVSFISKSRTKKISSGIISTQNPSFLEKLLLRIRGNFFIPDARIGWVKPSVNYLETYLKKNAIDILITTGPPHSLHLIGMNLTTRSGIPWIADFRDPWTTIHYHKLLQLSKKAAKKHLDLEQEVLQNADAVIVTSPSTKKEFALKTKTPITVITNGYDEESTKEEVILDTAFSLVHIGSLLSQRNPKILWEVLSEMATEDKNFATDLKIKLVGAVSDEVIKTINYYNLHKQLDIVGYVSHNEAIAIQKKSQILLLIESDRAETTAIIPGKVFEYLKANRPILALLPKNSDVASIVEDTHSGTVFLYTEKEKLKKELKRLYNAYQNGTIVCTQNNIKQYSRKALTNKMAQVIKTVLQTKTPD